MKVYTSAFFALAINLLQPALIPAAIAAEKEHPKSQPSAQLPGKVDEVKGLVEKLVNEGYDPAPIAKQMELAGKAMDQGHDFAEAEKMVDKALELAKNKDALKRPRPAGTPQEIQARLEGKLKTIQEGVAALLKSGKQPDNVRKKMEGFEALMKEGEVLKAEKLLDEAAELAKE